MAYTDTWDSSFENAPSDTENISQGASRIRDLKLAIRERMQKDHYWDPDGTDEDHGEHKWVTLREQSTKPSVATDKAALYLKSDGIYIEKEDGTELHLLDFDTDLIPESVSPKDIPSGEIILFEKDTAVAGYTLLTNRDDMIVYITKGSAAGGETGATDKSGGTWTQPSHSHSVPSHRHGLPFGIASSTFVYTTSPSTGSSRSFNRYAKSDGTSANVGRILTDSGGAGTSGSAATPNSWRPPGRNFTRQQRN